MDDILEEKENVDVDTRKVQVLAEYISDVLKAHGVEGDDITQVVTEDITNNYSTIMNDRSFFGVDCRTLESVQALMEKCSPIERSHLLVNIDETSMVLRGSGINEEDRYDIIWMTPERVREEYDAIMGRIQETRNTNNIIDPEIVRRESIRREKKALRRYIKEKGIEGINTDIEPVEIDHDMTNAIADLLMQGFRYTSTDKKEKILTYLESNWSEILGEDQGIQFNELHEAVFGESVINFDMIYLTDGMAYYNDHIDGKVIYATPEALKRTALATDEKISEWGLSAYLAELRNANIKYAEENGIELELLDLDMDEMKKKRMSMLSADDRYDIPEPTIVHQKTNNYRLDTQQLEVKKDITPSKKKRKDDDVIQPEDLKRRGKQHMFGFHKMLESIQRKIDSGEIPCGKRIKSLLSLERILCEQKDKEVAARNLCQEYQEQLPEESREEI